MHLPEINYEEKNQTKQNVLFIHPSILLEIVLEFFVM